MMRYTITAVALVLCWSASIAHAAPSGSALSPETPAPAAHDTAGSSHRADLDLSELVRSAPVSLRKAAGIAERLHRGARTAAIRAEPAAEGVVYKVRTVARRNVREFTISARTGAVLGERLASSGDEIAPRDEIELAALRRVGPSMVDAVAVAERSTGGTAVEGGLRTEDGRLKFVITVRAGDDLKEVILEPPGARLRRSIPPGRSQPARSPARTGASPDGATS